MIIYFYKKYCFSSRNSQGTYISFIQVHNKRIHTDNPFICWREVDCESLHIYIYWMAYADAYTNIYYLHGIIKL